MKILAFDTCLGFCSVVLLQDNSVTFRKNEEIKSMQAEILIPFLEEALRSNHIWYQDLNFLAVTNGPGSFTGLRIGLSAAKTISLLSDLPVFSCSTLEVQAFAELIKNPALKTIKIIQDAGRGMVYSQEFEFKNVVPIAKSEAEIISRELVGNSIEVKK